MSKNWDLKPGDITTAYNKGVYEVISDKPTLFENVWACDTGVGKYTDATLYALEIVSQTLIG